MKLTQYNTKIFVSELDDLSNLISKVSNQANTWIEGQERREKGYSFSQYEMQAVRIALEDQLNDLREKMALVYDFQGDRGMADFVPAGFNNDNKEEEEEVEHDPFDYEFLKESMMTTPIPTVETATSTQTAAVSTGSHPLTYKVP